MAATPVPELVFTEGCGDCGERRVELPRPLPKVGDDFDWLLRDYDGFRLFMLEELAGRFPERSRWTPADIEVILVEALAVILDQFSDQLDRAHSEAFLETARQPESVLRLLRYIGFDAVRMTQEPQWSDATLLRHLFELRGWPVETFPSNWQLPDSAEVQRLLVWMGEDSEALGSEPDLTDPETEQALLQLIGYQGDSLRDVVDPQRAEHRAFLTERLLQLWREQPRLMNDARAAGPRAVHTNRRMVSLTDYRDEFQRHPLVMRAQASQRWTGSWQTLEAVVVLVANARLDAAVRDSLSDKAWQTLRRETDRFHWHNRMSPVDWTANPSFRSLLRAFLEAYRMVGQEVWLQDAEPVGLSIGLSVRLSPNYYQSELRQSIAQVLGTGPEGFFAPGRLAFGEDIYASDLVAAVMQLDGVESVCLNRFKRVGARYADQSGSGRIALSGIEIARCDNRSDQPELGYWRLQLHGGQPG